MIGYPTGGMAKTTSSWYLAQCLAYRRCSISAYYMNGLGLVWLWGLEVLELVLLVARAKS